MASDCSLQAFIHLYPSPGKFFPWMLSQLNPSLHSDLTGNLFREASTPILLNQSTTPLLLSILLYFSL